MSSAVATSLLAYIPSPDRGVWYLGPVPIRAYALCIIAGIVVAVLWGERRFVARGGQPGTVTDVAVWAVPFGLIGGRLYHVATDWEAYFGPGADPVDALKIWQGGLGIWGAVLLGGVGAWIGCRRRGVPLPIFADAVAPGIVTAQAIGRLGNWFNQELYGGPTTLAWGLEIYRRVDPTTGVPDGLGGVALDRTPIEVVHPTFLYELLWDLAVAALVVWADRRFRLGHGRAFAVYVAGYTAGRFWIEQMRTDYATRVFGDIRINVVVSAVVFLGAVAYIVLVRKPREVPPQPEQDGPAELDERLHAPVGAANARSGAATTVLDRGPSRPAAGAPADDDAVENWVPPGTGGRAADDRVPTPAEAPPAEPGAGDSTGAEPAEADPVTPGETGAAPASTVPDPGAPGSGVTDSAAVETGAGPAAADETPQPTAPAEPAGTGTVAVPDSTPATSTGSPHPAALSDTAASSAAGTRADQPVSSDAAVAAPSGAGPVTGEDGASSTPAHPGSAATRPTASEPGASVPGVVEPVASDSTASDAASAEPAGPEPAGPEPAATTNGTASTDTAPTDTDSTGTAPTEPAPTEPALPHAPTDAAAAGKGTDRDPVTVEPERRP